MIIYEKKYQKKIKNILKKLNIYPQLIQLDCYIYEINTENETEKNISE